MSIQPKLIYLARRRVDMTRSQFIARWRKHGALGMSRPRWVNIARYVHCDVLDAGTALVGISNDFDGVGLIWHRSPAARAAHRSDTSSQADMEADEQETFREPVVNCCLLAREVETFLVHEPGADAIKLFRFLRYDSFERGKMTEKRLVENRRALGGMRRCRNGWPIKHCVNFPLPPENEAQASWGLSCDLVEEFWFDTFTALAGFREHCDTDAGILAPAIGDVVSSVEIVSNEVVLHDTAN